MLIGGMITGPNWLELRVQVEKGYKRLKVSLGSGEGIIGYKAVVVIHVRGDAGSY